MSPVVIHAQEHYDIDQDVRHLGITLSNLVIQALQSDSKSVIIVSFKGVRGAASSYFNIFLHKVAEWCGVQALADSTRLKFDFDSEPQRLMFHRSLRAVQQSKRAS